MEDPRDILKASFQGDSSDEDREEVDIIEQLGKLEYEKQKLLEQLKSRNDEKKLLSRAAKSPNVLEKREVEKIVNNQSTSFFIDNYEKRKQEEKIQKQHQQEFMKRRIHTFHGIESEYKPLSVEEIDKYSKKWLSQRYVPESVLDHLFQDKKILKLPKLYAKVRPPNFQEPEYANWVCCGIISAKSEVKVTSGLQRASKYFSITLTDFTFEIKVMIFGDENVKKYYNLNIGDIIGILNPSIWPWNEEHGKSRSFNLSIKSQGTNSIVEIGKSRDFGTCPIRNYKTKEKCNTPINLETDDRCSYHQEKQINKGNSKRIELNGVNTALRGPKNRDLVRLSNGQYITTRKEVNKSELERAKFENLKHKHRFSSTNAAKAFYDDEYVNPDMLKNISNKRRLIKDYNDEKKLRNKLGLSSLSGKSNAAHNANGTKKLRIDINNVEINDRVKRFIAPNLLNEKEIFNDKKSAIDDLKKVQKSKDTQTLNLRSSKSDIEARIKQKREIWDKYKKTLSTYKPTLGDKGYNEDDDDDDDDLFIVQ